MSNSRSSRICKWVQPLKHALITKKIHEQNMLLRVMKVEKVYGFTQQLAEEKLLQAIPKNRKTLCQFFDRK